MKVGEAGICWHFLTKERHILVHTSAARLNCGCNQEAKRYYILQIVWPLKVEIRPQ